MAVREFLQLTHESAYGTILVSPVRGTSQIVARLDADNAFSMRSHPVSTTIDHGGGFAVPVLEKSDQQEIKGTLQLKLCYSQASFLLGWLLTRVADATGGHQFPWDTTEPYGDLASVCIDHAIYQEDPDHGISDYKRTRYTGVKATQGRFSISRDSRIGTLSLDIQAKLYQGNTFDSSSDPDATAFPIPGESEYATDLVLFSHSAGHFTLGASRNRYAGLELSWENRVDPQWFETPQFLDRLRCYGRLSKLTADAMLKVSPNDRSDHEHLVAKTMSLAFTNGTNTITLDYKTNNIIRTLDDNLPNAKTYFRKIGVQNYWDVAALSGAGADIVFTYA